jgi:hypothetical protein
MNKDRFQAESWLKIERQSVQHASPAGTAEDSQDIVLGDFEVLVSA